MDIYNKVIPFDIYDTLLFSKEKFSKSNLITIRLGDFNLQKFYSLTVVLKDIILSDDSQSEIRNLFDITSSSAEITVNDNYIWYSIDIDNYSTGNNKLNEHIKNIFRILVKFNYITNQIFFGISYNHLDNLYNGYLTYGEIDSIIN